MKNLLIEQRGAIGILKVWRIRAEDDSASFGSSKHADLRSIDPSIKGIQGQFEFSDNQWKYINLDIHSANLEESVETNIAKPVEIKAGNTILRVVPFDGKNQLFQLIEDYSKPTADKQAYQLFTVHFGDTMLESQVVTMKGSFTSQYDHTRTKLKPQQSDKWVRSSIAGLEIQQRTVYLDKLESLKNLRKEALFEKENRGPLYATLIGALLLAVLFLISPNSKDAGEAAVAALPPQEYREIKLEKPKKKIAKEVPKSAPPQQASAAKAEAQRDPASVPQGGSKSISAIKSIGASRISSLLGKVSAGTARSNNVVVTTGVVAGTAPSGRALAALGNATKGDKDWGKEGVAKGTAVSTVGTTNSSGISAMGKIGTGKAGSGGAELLEDESEVIGGLDREIIAAYIRSQLGQILYCYERQLSASPDLYGKVAIKFTIGPNGEVETQRIGETTLKNANVEGCILQRVARWKFPAPEGGTKVNVTYPFLFKSTN